MDIQVIVLLITFVVTTILGIIAIPILKKLHIGQVVRSDGPKEHLKKSGTPTMGGIIMIVSMAVILIVMSFWYPKLLIPLILVIGFGAVGFIDDYKKLVLKNPEGLSPKKKMFGLFIVSSIFIVAILVIYNMGTDIIVPIWQQPIVLPIIIYIGFTMFMLLGVSNAVNLTDGLDGLCTSVVSIIMIFFTIIAIKNQDVELAIFGACTVGTTVSFLIFNINPAKVFMGDTGSLALGGAVVAISIMLKMPLYLILVAIIPLLEALSVMAQVVYFKLTKGKRLLKMAPLHHHFELCGIQEKKVVLLFVLVTIVSCVIAYFI